MADADGWTNRGSYRILEWVLKAAWSAGAQTPSVPTSFYVALITDAAFDPDWNDMGDVTEVTAANGYTSGGIQVTRDATGFDTLTEVDASDWVLAQIKNLAWTASGGTIPNIKMAVLTDNHATVASREILFVWDVVDVTVPDGAIYQLEDLEIKIDTVA